MGIFVRVVQSAEEGDTIQVPAKTGSVNKVYASSANLTYVSVATNAGDTQIPKAVSTDYQSGFFPVQEAVNAPMNVVVHGPATAEDVTLIVEFV